MVVEKIDIESVAFESKTPDRGYTVKASYLKEPKGDALVEVFKDGLPVRSFLFPAYKVWNIAAHFSDIVDGEIEQSASGYKMAAWDGISGAAFLDFNAEADEEEEDYAGDEPQSWRVGGHLE